MESRAGIIHHVVRGTGRPVIVLHGAGDDHREPESCYEPVFAGAGLRRVYPDLPGAGASRVPDGMRSAADVLDALADFADRVTDGDPYLLVGHSAGGYFAQAMARRHPTRVAGLALVCSLLAGVRDLPDHRPVIASDLGDDDFRSYFVIQTPEMLDRYERFFAPAAALVDGAAAERIGDRWELPSDEAPYPGPALIVAGRQDATVGSAAAVELAQTMPHAALAVLDDAGHALPHEQPEVLRALCAEWLVRVGRSA